MFSKRVHRQVARYAHAKKTVRLDVGFARIIDIAAAERRHPDWKRLRAIDVAGEPERLRAWIDHLFRIEPPTGRIRGLFFDICQPVREDGSVTADVRLGGTKQSHRQDPDWIYRQSYRPSGYAWSAVLHSLYGIAYGTHDLDEIDNPRTLATDAEYPLGLVYAVLAVRAALDGMTSRDVPRAGQMVSIASGFGEGDLVLLGELTRSGFVPNDGDIWVI